MAVTKYFLTKNTVMLGMDLTVFNKIRLEGKLVIF